MIFLNSNETKPKKKIDYQLAIFVLQISVCILILASALVLRVFGGELYSKLSRFFNSEFSQKTSVTEVIGEMGSQKESAKTTSEATESLEVLGDADVTVIESDFDEGLSEDTSVSSQLNITPTVAVSSKNSLKWPLEGTVTSDYGDRENPFTGGEECHGGIDIAAKTGTKVLCVLDGIVEESRYSESYGYFVKVKHSDSFQTLYAHCSKLSVDVGDKVSAGQVIALSGSTGQSTGPHLHFETIINGEKINPGVFLAEK